MFDDKRKVFSDDCARSMSVLDSYYEPLVKRNRGLLMTGLVSCICVTAFQVLAAAFYLDEYDNDVDTVLGIACTIMMIPSFSSFCASIVVLFLLGRYGSSKIAMGPIRRRTTSEVNDLETGLLEHKAEDEGEEEDIFNASRKSCCNSKCALKYALLLHFVITTFVIMTSLILTSVMGPFWQNISKHTGHSRWYHSIVFWASELTLVVTHVYALWGSVNFCWTSQKNVARRLLLTANVFVFGISISIMVMNHYFKVYHVKDIHIWVNQHTSVRIGLQVCAVLMCIKAVMGFATTLVTFSSMKDKFLSSTSMPLPYLIFEYAIQFLTFIFTALALTLFTILLLEEGAGFDDAAAAMGANGLVGMLVLIANYAGARAYSFLLNPTLPSGYRVEEIRVEDMPKKLLRRWAKMIDDSNGINHIGAWDGTSALEMIRMYQKEPCDNMKGICLRVYVPSPSLQETKEEREEEKEEKEEEEEEEKKFTEKELYEDQEVGVDGETIALVFITVIDRFDLSQYVKQRYLKCILETLFGAKSMFPLLCLRFGILGFQWPFHSGVFLCRRPKDNGVMSPASDRRFRRIGKVITAELLSTNRPHIDRMTRVLRACVEWNDALNSKLMKHVLMVPSYVTSMEPYACQDAHFLNLPLGPSSIADLRPYINIKPREVKGNSGGVERIVDAYERFKLHALRRSKRRPYEKNFENKGHKIHLVHGDFSEFDSKYAEHLHDLWYHIAGKRVGQGEAATLLTPKPKMFEILSKELSPRSRSLLGLKLKNNVPIGSAILFRFQKAGLLTSDIQGLNHELARPQKGYFVMLYAAIRHAIESKMKWVDMGPTTAEPKVDAGCSVVSTRGGYHTRSILLRAALKRGANDFRKTNQSGSSESDMKYDEECFQPGLLDDIPTLRNRFKVSEVNLAEQTRKKWAEQDRIEDEKAQERRKKKAAKKAELKRKKAEKKRRKKEEKARKKKIVMK